MSRRYWSPAEIAKLQALYPHMDTGLVAMALHRKTEAVLRKAFQLKIRKTTDFWRRQAARPGVMAAHQFAKGHANKGTRRPGWAPGRMAETQFKKGQMAGAARKLWRPIGTIVPDAEGYLRIKVRERKPGANESGWHRSVWPLLHHLVWEENHGPIPVGCTVVFRNGDRSDCAIENLECISRGELARRNRMWVRLPRELAEAIQLNGALKRVMKRKASEASNG